MKDGKEYAYDKRRATISQTWAALALHSLNMGVGMVVATPVFIIGALRESNTDLHFTEQQASWFGGIMFVAQPLGSLVLGVIQENVSRRTSLIAVNLPLIIAWLVVYFATNTTHLLFGMAVLGLSAGSMEAPVLAYIGEITEPRLRGVLGSLGGIAVYVGILITSAVGAVASWRAMVLFNISGPVISAVAMALVPDSPPWLMAQGRVEEAQKAYQWLRGWTTPKAVLEELNDIIFYVQERKSALPNGEAGHDGVKVSGKVEFLVNTFLQPAIQTPLRLIVCYIIITVCATLWGMKHFIVEELKTFRIPINSNTFLFFSAMFTFLGAMTATLSLPILDKRCLTFVSLALSVFSGLGLGLYVILGLDCPVVPLLLLLLSSYAATLGIIFIPWVLISEVFPLKGRGLASGFAAATFYVFMFIAIKTYHSLRALVGLGGACLLYGGVGAVGFFYLYHNLPETERVPMVDVEAMFVKKPTLVPGEVKEISLTQRGTR